MSELVLRWIEQDSEHYAAERALRYEVLRKPLGMPLGSEENAAEARCDHCVALLDGVVVGCVLWLADGPSASPPASRAGKLMQMAVAESMRGQEVGRRLVRELERKVAADGVAVVRMHARESALPFYDKLGYEVVSELFSEVGIPHRVMRRTL